MRVSELLILTELSLVIHNPAMLSPPFNSAPQISQISFEKSLKLFNLNLVLQADYCRGCNIEKGLTKLNTTMTIITKRGTRQ